MGQPPCFRMLDRRTDRFRDEQENVAHTPRERRSDATLDRAAAELVRPSNLSTRRHSRQGAVRESALQTGRWPTTILASGRPAAVSTAFRLRIMRGWLPAESGSDHLARELRRARIRDDDSDSVRVASVEKRQPVGRRD